MPPLKLPLPDITNSPTHNNNYYGGGPSTQVHTRIIIKVAFSEAEFSNQTQCQQQRNTFV